MERFGPFSFDLELAVSQGRLIYRVRGWRIGPAPAPRALAPITRTQETVDAQWRFTFDVEIGLPLIGRLADPVCVIRRLRGSACG